MRRVFVGLAQVFVGLAAQLRNNRLLQKLYRAVYCSCDLSVEGVRGKVL